ncbi:transcriptional repressor [Marinobacter sp. M3C]|uniref:Fur family transcriptional regulator n=1 Tax=Marinobacter sp. M3C TaxID=2917715 RepID=UPI00200E62C0|nr:Fur family transcriptional regulator [Marinobacter sp. M3C]UQG58894.1 transcriptional repressor [Marinobacter sp. M3C]
MPARALPYRPHNHDLCVDQALAQARDTCRRNEARLTPIRERVLELIWQSHKPLGAYDVLAQLSADGHKAAPPTVYRALDFLQQHGLVHRIASLNAFTGCDHPGQNHCGTFLICRSCGNVLELAAPNITAAINQAATAETFQVEQITLEIAGLCPRCQSDSTDQPTPS